MRGAEITLDDFLGRLRNPRRSGDGWATLCPAHEDRERSLSVAERDGKILVRCFKGCRTHAVVDALRLTMADLFIESRQNGGPPGPAKRMVATYDYCAADGTLLYQNVRYEPKTFRVRRPDGQGGWLWSLGEVRRVVYRLPELAEQPVVYLVEGEKDADRLWSLHLPATTGAAGAESWRDEYGEQIAAAGVRDIIVIPDNDEPGMKFANAATESLTRRGIRVTLVRLPDLPPMGSSHGADVSDWLDAGHTREELVLVVDEALRLKLSKLPRPIAKLFTVPPRQPVWLVENLIRERSNGWIGAGAKVGKSYAALDLLVACALGEPWLGKFPIARPLTVVLIEEEDDEWRIYDRVTKLCKGRDVPLPENLYVTIRAGYRLDDKQAMAPLKAWFEDYRPDLIVWDVFNRLHHQDERRPDQIMPVLWELDQLRNDLGCANLLAHHSRKAGPTGPDLASGGQRLRGPSEFWGWAENSLYLSPLKGKGAVVIEPESKDAIVEPFKAHLADTALDARRWEYDGTVQARVEKGNETRAKILALIGTSPQTASQLADAARLSEKTIAKHLGALEAEGLAEFVREPGRNGRRLWLAVSNDEQKQDDDRNSA